MTAIVAVDNEEEHLSQRLESLRDLSYRPLEIIVADDGSTDKSAYVAWPFPEARLISLPHLGKAKPVNAAARDAQGGDILLFLDGDLYFDRDYVGVLVAQVLSGTDIGSRHSPERVANPETLWSHRLQMKGGFPPDLRLRLSPDEMVPCSIIFPGLRRDLFVAVSAFDDTGDDQALFLTSSPGRCSLPKPSATTTTWKRWGRSSARACGAGNPPTSSAGPAPCCTTCCPGLSFASSAPESDTGARRFWVYDVVFEAGTFLGLFMRTLRFDHTYGR